MKFIIWFFYIIGIIYTGTLLHELYHFYNCGGEFVSGLAYIKNEWQFAITWCERVSFEGEFIPTSLEVLYDIVFVWLKVKYDKSR